MSGAGNDKPGADGVDADAFGSIGESVLDDVRGCIWWDFWVRLTCLERPTMA